MVALVSFAISANFAGFAKAVSAAAVSFEEAARSLSETLKTMPSSQPLEELANRSYRRRKPRPFWHKPPPAWTALNTPPKITKVVGS